MAKIDVIGNVAVIKTALKPEEILALMEYEPEKLSLYRDDANGQKVKYFTVGYITSEGEKGSVSKYGIIFDTVLRNEKVACVVIDIPSGVSDINEYVTKYYGSVLINLIKVEGDVGGALDSIKLVQDKIEEMITIH